MKWWRWFLCISLSSQHWLHKNIPILFLDKFQQFAHHFNKNCLTISIFYLKSKFEQCSSIGIVFKVQNQNWLLFGQILSGFRKYAPHFDENCLTILNLFSKSKSDYRSSKGDDFSELDCLYTMTFSLGGGRWYYNGPQPTALGLIWPSWRHQNRRFSTNVLLFARSYLS
jgi:hypothetical protein